jgi:hypothetical protein
MEARLHVGFFSFIDNDWFWPFSIIRFAKIHAWLIAALCREAAMG